jgi:SAM-dependent methyltransferase
VNRHSPLLSEYLPLLQAAAHQAPVLDLACGRGRNGLYLLDNGCRVTFADRDNDALFEVAQQVASRALQQKSLARLWQQDFEQGNKPLAKECYGAVIVFRYLHRPLMEQLKQAVLPGGLIIYETFTTAQPQYGRPTNPDFLLKPGELSSYFTDWQQHFYFEGVQTVANGTCQQAVAQLVAQKPSG